MQTIFFWGLSNAIPSAIDEQCPIDPTVRPDLLYGCFHFFANFKISLEVFPVVDTTNADSSN